MDKMKWQEDPAVVFENALLPALWHGQQLLLGALCAEDAKPGGSVSAELTPLDTAIQMLRSGGPAALKNTGVQLAPRVIQCMVKAADQFAALRSTLMNTLSGKVTPESARPVLALITDEVLPAAQEALNAFREAFLDHILTMQRNSVVKAREAIAGLDQISKQIFFISINASVEAARAGDAGRGFTQISTDIRALSQSAQEATRGFADLVRA